MYGLLWTNDDPHTLTRAMRYRPCAPAYIDPRHAPCALVDSGHARHAPRGTRAMRHAPAYIESAPAHIERNPSESIEFVELSYLPGLQLAHSLEEAAVP